jgi:hypothetical protein
MFSAIIGLIPSIIVAIILFLINPIFGVIWVLWRIGVAIYTLKRR